MSLRGTDSVALSVLVELTELRKSRLMNLLGEAPRARMNTKEPWYRWSTLRDLLPEVLVTRAHRKYLQLEWRPIGSANVASGHPELVTSWHRTKNRALRPWHVSAGTTEKVWWFCLAAEDHVWAASVANRSRLGNACPYCVGKKVCPSNSLASLDFEVAAEWDTKRNAPLTPFDVTVGSKKRVWWRCAKGRDHVWHATVETRTGPRRAGCPFCANDRVAANNSLAKRFHRIAKEWDDERNAPLTPRDVVFGSTRRVWWKCSKGDDHQWEMPVNARTGKRQSGCPFCANIATSRTNALDAHFPVLTAEWDVAKNAALRPSVVTSGSTRKVWWRCAFGHSWQARIVDRTKRGSGCRRCFYEQRGAE